MAAPSVAQRHVVIDSNVLVAANGESDQANSHCVDVCIEMLHEARESWTIALDRDGEIIAEYSTKCVFGGKPGLGHEFFRWVFDNRYAICHLVDITRHSEREFEEFPDREDLKAFDRSDRKFAATALTSVPQATVWNAVDSDWSECEVGFAAIGLDITELCPDCLKISGVA